MLFSFFESIKYVGHLYPIALLRVFVGTYYLQMALGKFQGDFLIRPKLASEVSEILPSLQIPGWYQWCIETMIIPHWQMAAFVLMAIEMSIAISYILGYVVRPIGVLAAIAAINMMVLGGQDTEDLYRIFIIIHLTLAWVGAGRCLGLDYYFFKRRRGLWW